MCVHVFMNHKTIKMYIPIVSVDAYYYTYIKTMTFSRFTICRIIYKN